MKTKEHLLSRSQMADACGISTTAFDKWRVEPFKKQGRMMMYRVSDVIENRIENDTRKSNNSANKDPDFIDVDFEKAWLTREQRITQSIKNEILEGKAIPVEAARDVLAKILSQVGATLDSLAPNIKRRHPEIEQRTIDFIKSEIIKHQNEAANLDGYIDDILDEVISEAEAKI